MTVNHIYFTVVFDDKSVDLEGTFNLDYPLRVGDFFQYDHESNQEPITVTYVVVYSDNTVGVWLESIDLKGEEGTQAEHLEWFRERGFCS